MTRPWADNKYFTVGISWVAYVHAFTAHVHEQSMNQISLKKMLCIVTHCISVHVYVSIPNYASDSQSPPVIIPHSHTHSLTHPPTHTLTHSLTQPLPTHPLPRSSTAHCPPTHSLTAHPLTSLLTHSYSPTHSLFHPLTHPPTHLLPTCPLPTLTHPHIH